MTAALGGKPFGALASLTAAALALPAFQAAAGARDETTTVSLRASQYLEDELPQSQVAGGSQERYDISAFRLRAALPVLESFRVTGDLGYETLSGASPWYVVEGEDGQPMQIMSGATIDEERIDVSIDTRHYGQNSEHALVLGYSTENDYTAANVGVEGLYTLGDQHTSVNLGAGYSDDTVEPTEGGTLQRVVEEQRDAVDVVIGLTRILGARTVLQSAVSYTVQSGFLSDPYKLAMVDGVAVPDSRPDEREQFAWTTRLRHRLEDVPVSLHLDYRYFSDSWNVESHTLELALYQEWGDNWWLTPSLRYYSQSQADFYRPFYPAERADGHYSSDYRLSPYGAITIGLALRRKLGEHAVSLSAEYYDSDADYALGSVEVENPGLVDFALATLGFDFSL